MRPNILVKRFPDGESYVRVLRLDSLKNRSVVIHKQLYPELEKNIFELLLILSVVRKNTKKISVFVPYLPYARQDRENKPGEAVSADVLCRLLKSHGVEKLITYDCHFLPRPGNFVRARLQIENRTAGPLLLAHAKKFFKGQKFIVVSPDQGASYFTKKEFAMRKHRKNEREIHKMHLKSDIKGKNVCILDDIISTGGTVLHAIKHLRKAGAKKIIVGAVHGVFALPDIAHKIEKNCALLFTTDSILNKEKKLKILKLPLEV